MFGWDPRGFGEGGVESVVLLESLSAFLLVFVASFLVSFLWHGRGELRGEGPLVVSLAGIGFVFCGFGQIGCAFFSHRGRVCVERRLAAQGFGWLVWAFGLVGL